MSNELGFAGRKIMSNELGSSSEQERVAFSWCHGLHVFPDHIEQGSRPRDRGPTAGGGLSRDRAIVDRRLAED